MTDVLEDEPIRVLGSVHQGRYKSFPVQDDAHLTTVLRYVE